MSTYSPSLRVELITSGDQAGTWGNTTNDNFAYIFDAAIAGYQTVSVTSANQAFTYNNGPVSTASLNQSVYAMLRLTTTTGAAFSVYAPPNSKQYIIWNNSGYAATIYNSTVIGNTTAAGTGVTIADGDRVLVWSNGTNFYEIKTNNITGTVAIANGGTGQTTANAAFNALAPSQTGNNGRYLKSDGTNTSWDAIDLSTADITGVLPAANGGTGVNNGSSTITLGGNLVTSGAFAITLTASGATNVTLPTTGTLATLAGTETLSNKTLVAPALGTPSSGTLTNCTGLPMTTGVTGTLPVANGGTGVTSSTGTGSVVLSASPALTGTPTAPTRGLGDATMAIANTAFVQAAIERIYPIGSIYINATNSANPSTFFGFGTWTAFGAGLVPVGFNAGNPLFDAAEKTGGSANAIVVSHTHTFSTTTSTKTLTGTITNQYVAGDTYGTTTGVFSQTNMTVDGDGGEGRPGRDIAFDGTHDHTVSGTTGSTGSLATDANYQPFITVFMWKRTA